MNERLRRAAAPGVALLLLTTACGDNREATGECRGTHLGEQVDWPIDGELSRMTRERFGLASTMLLLKYLPGGQAGLMAFGVSASLTRGISINRSNGPLIVQLLPLDKHLAPEEGSPLLYWSASHEDALSTIPGYPNSSGLPASGTLTLEEVGDDFAEGHFVYRYVNGDELTCTFNIPTPNAAGDAWDDSVGGDDDDDD